LVKIIIRTWFLFQMPEEGLAQSFDWAHGRMTARTHSNEVTHGAVIIHFARTYFEGKISDIS